MSFGVKLSLFCYVHSLCWVRYKVVCGSIVRECYEGVWWEGCNTIDAHGEWYGEQRSAVHWAAASTQEN